MSEEKVSVDCNELESKVKNHCSGCDSTSMEMCLMIRHCEHWRLRKEDNYGIHRD